MAWRNIILHQRFIDCSESTFHLLLAALFLVWRLDFGRALSLKMGIDQLWPSHNLRLSTSELAVCSEQLNIPESTTRFLLFREGD